MRETKRKDVPIYRVQHNLLCMYDGKIDTPLLFYYLFSTHFDFYLSVYTSVKVVLGPRDPR